MAVFRAVRFTFLKFGALICRFFNVRFVLNISQTFFTEILGGSRNILRRKILHPNNSSPDNPSVGYFYATKILCRMILRRKVLRPDNSSPENSPFEKKSPEWDNSSKDNSSLGYFFFRKILRRIILRRKVLLQDDSLPENSSPEGYRNYFVYLKNSKSEIFQKFFHVLHY
jgi:hypothetical protein